MYKISQKIIFVGICLSLSACFNFASQIKPSAMHNSSQIFKNGVSCIESKKTSLVTVCLQSAQPGNRLNEFYVMVKNLGTENRHFDPLLITISLSSGGSFSVVPASNYMTSIQSLYSNDMSQYPLKGKDTPSWVLDERSKIEKSRATRLSRSNQLLLLNTVRPGEEIQGYVPFSADYQKKGVVMVVTVPVGQEKHEFEYLYE